MKRPRNIDEVLNHPLVRAINPVEHNFVRIIWLSSQLNPISNNIKIGAAVAFINLPHIKIVPAFGMLVDDFYKGRYENVHTLVVPSSGNTADAVASLARAFGIERVKVIMPSDAPETKKSIITLTPWASLICPPGNQTVAQVAQEEASQRGHYLLDQYSHEANPKTHEECTGPKLWHAAGDDLALVAIAMGSAGTVLGVSRYLKRMSQDITIVGVRPNPGERVPGSRDAKQMKEVVRFQYEPFVDVIQEVSRVRAFEAARKLLTEVLPRVGPSSGMAFAGLVSYLSSLQSSRPEVLEKLHGKKAVFVCTDDARFYSGPMLSTLDPDQGIA